MQTNHKIIKMLHSVFSLLPLLFLCSCMVNGQVVLRPEDIIAKASGRTEDQVIESLKTNFIAYQSAASGSDYAAIVTAAKKAQTSFEDAFYLLGDKDGSWRSAVFVKKEGSQAPFVSDKTKSTLGRGYISILHNLARMSLVVNDRGGYYSYINRAVSPDPKLFNYNLMDTALEAPQQLEVTLLFSLRSSYRYFMEGHIDEAVEIAEILKLTMDKVTREYPRLWEVKGPELGVTYRQFYNSLTFMLANYYLISGDQAKAEDTVKYLVTNTKDTSLLVRSYLLMAVIKDRFKEDYYAKSYVEKALTMVKENGDANLLNIFLGSLPYHFIEKYLAKNDWLPGMLEKRQSLADSNSTEYFIAGDTNLIAAELFRNRGMKEQMNLCLSEFERGFSLDNAVRVNDLAVYANILAREKNWQRLADFVWPLVDDAEYYRDSIASSRYAATAFSGISELFANLALALYHSDASRVGRYADNWQASLGSRSSEKKEILFKVIQLAKSRGILNVLSRRQGAELPGKLADEVSAFEGRRTRLLQETIFEPRLEQIANRIVPQKKANRREWKMLRQNMVATLPGLFGGDYRTLPVSGKRALLEFCVAADSILYYTLAGGELNVGLVKRGYDQIQKQIMAYYCRLRIDPNDENARGLKRQEHTTANTDPKNASNELLRYLVLDTGVEASTLSGLSISPDKALGMLPFDVLFQQSDSAALQQMEVSYIPSASVLSLFNGRGTATGKNILLMGDPLPFITSETTGRQSENQPVNHIQTALRGLVARAKPQAAVCSVSEKLDKFEPAKRIPYTAEEIGTIENIMKGKGYKAQTLLGANLAKEKIIAGLAAKPRILHFATHGVMSNEIPYILNPTLILSLTERPIDTFLQSSEIEKLDLSGVELVVLSACKTGIDVSSDNEGISGIAKSFLIAGAKNVLLTYWSINDMATSVFMEYLYGEIGNGVPVAKALSNTRKQFVSGAIAPKPLTSEPSSRGLSARQKQVASGADYTLPFYWGAFALFGKD